MKYTLLLALILFTTCKNDTEKGTKSELDKETTQIETPMEKTTYYFIRHAEKDLSDPTNQDPHLTDEGLERAKFWGEYFSDKSLEMVYSTKYTRTIQTAIPTLDTTKLQLAFYDTNTLYSPKFLKETQGKTVLIIGHQLSAPTLINKLLGEKKYEKIPADVYGNLFTVVFEIDGSKHSTVEKLEGK